MNIIHCAYIANERPGIVDTLFWRFSWEKGFFGHYSSCKMGNYHI